MTSKPNVFVPQATTFPACVSAILTTPALRLNVLPSGVKSINRDNLVSTISFPPVRRQFFSLSKRYLENRQVMGAYVLTSPPGLVGSTGVYEWVVRFEIDCTYTPVDNQPF